MKKLLQFLDNNILKIGVIFTSLFIVLYPKLPSIHITYTWVYVRLEDFFILGLTVLWLIQLLRKKVKLALPLGIPIIIYWIVGVLALINSIIFIGPHLIQFFPKIAALEYGRRIEYMILFFVGFSTIKDKKDLKDYVKFLFIGIAAIITYGFAQHFYPYFWKYLPVFIQKTNFCFPSFQTGNEEFAKGIPLCLPVGSRVTSTFGGHYDLAGYLIITLPIILGSWFLVKKKVKKIGLGLLFITGLIMLILTSSRIAFIAYIFAVIPPLLFLKKKKWILPVLLISFLCLVLFSEATIRRFAQTFRLTSVVVNMQGQIVGTTENGLTAEQLSQLAKNNKAIQANQVIQGVVPEGSSFITLPQQRTATTSALIQKGISGKDAEKLKLANGGLELSTIKGNFSIQKALVYDISVTTRLQGEWPHAIQSFLTNPFLGTGYSTLTLAVDNDYLRLLGESGILGFVAFLGIFIGLSIFLRQILPHVDDPLTKIFTYGLMGGIIGLFVNAALFDIFEASKIAEPLWLMLGVGAGAIALYQKKPVRYLEPLRHILTSNTALYIYLFIMPFVIFWRSISNFFIGDDFVWLKWAATSTFSDIPKYFTDASGFFYRPLDKIFMLLFYSLFSFQPQGYHIVNLFIHALMCLGVYSLIYFLIKEKLWAFIGAVSFLLLPMHAENIFWISSLSIDLSSMLILFTVILYIKSSLSVSFARWIRYVGAVILAALALLSYELALVIPLLIFVSDLFVTKKLSCKRVILYIPFAVLDLLYLFIRISAHAFGMGGDYSYNVFHFLPNLVGNILGYIGLFIFGEWSLPYYAILRNSTKQYALPIGLIIIIVILLLVVLIRKIKWQKVLREKSIPLFALCFTFVALLPYVGLGNIAERYGYLASFGMVLFVVWATNYFLNKLNKNKVVYYTVLSLIGSAVLLYSVAGLQKAYSEWTFASKVTYNTLGFFKIENDYNAFTKGSTLVIVNRPILFGNAWIFPVGLPEGLWFVYGDQTPQVLDASSLDQARQIVKNRLKTYLFIFDSSYTIKNTK